MSGASVLLLIRLDEFWTKSGLIFFISSEVTGILEVDAVNALDV